MSFTGEQDRDGAAKGRPVGLAAHSCVVGWV